MMTSSISKLDLASGFHGMATREAGDSALMLMLKALDEADVLELDFGGQAPTPSFADQSLGNLAKHLGFDVFRQRVRLANVPESARNLIRHVVLKAAS